jgi:hypothetical protein
MPQCILKGLTGTASLVLLPVGCILESGLLNKFGLRLLQP